jgi:hypothetical protein
MPFPNAGRVQWFVNPSSHQAALSRLSTISGSVVSKRGRRQTPSYISPLPRHRKRTNKLHRNIVWWKQLDTPPNALRFYKLSFKLRDWERLIERAGPYPVDGPYLAEVFFQTHCSQDWVLATLHFQGRLFLLGLGLEYPYRVAGTNMNLNK